MDDKKYEIIDPDESKYKLTAADLKKERKQIGNELAIIKIIEFLMF